MRFVKTEKFNWKPNCYKKTKLQKLLEEFLESDYDIALIEYEDGEYNSVQSAAASLSNAIKRFRLVGVKCVIRYKNAYLVKVPLDDCQ